MKNVGKRLIGLVFIAVASFNIFVITPSIQASGGGGAVTITENKSLSLKIKLDAGAETGLADW